MLDLKQSINQINRHWIVGSMWKNLLCHHDTHIQHEKAVDVSCGIVHLETVAVILKLASTSAVSDRD